MPTLTEPERAQRKVAAATKRTINHLPKDVGDKILDAFQQPFDPLYQDYGENRALSKLIQQEDRGEIRVDVHMLRLARSIAYRAIREEMMAAERLGCPKVVAEALKDTRLYMAGFLAGRQNAWKAIEHRGGQAPADARPVENVRGG